MEINEQVVETQEQQVEQSPQMIGDLEVSSVNEALTTHYGEDFTLDRIEELRSLPDKYKSLETDYEKAKVQFENDRYAHPIIANLDKMAREGGNTAEWIKYLTVQDMNLDEMKPDDLIKQRKAMERPTWQSKDIDAWFKTEYPDLDEDAEEFEITGRDIKLRDAAEDAKSYLQEQIVQAEEPKSVKDKAAKEQEMQKLQKNYGVLADSLMKHVDTIPYKFEDKKFGEYQFDFKVPQNDETYEQVKNIVVNTAISEKWPMDDAGIENIKESIFSTYKMMNHDKIVESIVHDAYASLNKKVAQEHSNSLPVQKGSGATLTPAPKKREIAKTEGGRTFV